jgi:hypothetical protein
MPDKKITDEDLENVDGGANTVPGSGTQGGEGDRSGPQTDPTDIAGLPEQHREEPK